ncbi:MAG: carbamoyltransferase HypF [Gammaproteobacteria bacterium]|nr:carbamoyltransferase HypF [Gammaproteobacteria bacterium]MCF6361906.1 carbamoyltransferase HypF [Gammaproteobacteria bacterium]
MRGEAIRVSGVVQGVGFRPFVWRLARQYGVAGDVCNDAAGVLVHAWADADTLCDFRQRLRSEAPPLARVEAVACTALDEAAPAGPGFHIVDSGQGQVRTGVAADAATCSDCLGEVRDPANRRYRYPFTNCTHCGPRLSIVRAIPYDRVNTSMAAFTLCLRCQAEYDDPADRRFHAQPNACPACGPQLWLEDDNGQSRPLGEGEDALVAAARLIRAGWIVAIKGLGGFHLACDAGNAVVVGRLRQRKHRDHKALALMARDLEMVARYAELDEQEVDLLRSVAAPIVVLKKAGEALPDNIAPSQDSLGFMLPYTPLHQLLMQALERPLVMTSGNRSDEPQVIDNEEARRCLNGIADYFLLHDRDIVNRLDDSVLRLADGRPRLLRRARGYAPQTMALPEGLPPTDGLLAMGADMKNTFCLLTQGRAILSPHIGDLQDAVTQADYREKLRLYRRLFDVSPAMIVVDKHPDYLSTRLGRALAEDAAVPLVEVQHHHAHIAACLADNGWPQTAGPVLGVALDGLGYGEDGGLWGGEFLLADYRHSERLARFQPVPMPGGAKASREAWRNAYAHLCTAFGWSAVREEYGDLALVRHLDEKPLATLDTMMARGINSPLTSSCGRLFDAVAAALGICRDVMTHEGQAAMALEALAAPAFQQQVSQAYGFEFIAGEVGLLGWRPLWRALLTDLRAGVRPELIAARFHQGLAWAVAETAQRLCAQRQLGCVALGGGVFQNRLLLEGVSERLRAVGLRVLSPAQASAGDGGLALGQAVIGATVFGESAPTVSGQC